MCTPNICAYTCRCVGACVHFSLWPRIFHMREDFILKRNKELFCSNSIHRKHFRKKKTKTRKILHVSSNKCAAKKNQRKSC